MVCAAAFGNHIETAMTASLRGVLATIVQAAYSVAVILTFPLQAFPAMQVTCNAILGPDPVPDSKSVCNGLTYGVKRSILAALVILSLGVIAVVSIDFLGNVVSIMGSLFGIPVSPIPHLTNTVHILQMVSSNHFIYVAACSDISTVDAQ